MKFIHVVAASENGVIGCNGCLPWHLPSDLEYFKKLTLGHIVIMGRNTLVDCIGHYLPNRTNIILSNSGRIPDSLYNPHKYIEYYIANNMRSCLNLASGLANRAGKEVVYIIGGERVYRETLDIISGIYFTIIRDDGVIKGEKTYPLMPTPWGNSSNRIDNGVWKEISRLDHPIRNGENYSRTTIKMGIREI